MEYIAGINKIKLQKTAITLGKFDGLHKGHQLLIEEIISYKSQGYKAVMFSFILNPGNFSPKKSKQLYTEVEKIEIAREAGIDYLISYPFDDEIRNMEAEDFIEKVLVEQLGAKIIVVGSDFRFGHNRKGNVELLKRFESKYDYKTCIFDKMELEGTIVSSSHIKKILQLGDIEKVNFFLGRPFFVTGEVVHGRKVGRTLGMPTTNLRPSKEKYLPPPGVYTSRTIIKGKSYGGVTSVGFKPTVGDHNDLGVETFMFDYDGDLYGQEIKVELCSFVRKEKKFSSLEDLKKQMILDIDQTKEYFEKNNKFN